MAVFSLYIYLALKESLIWEISLDPIWANQSLVVTRLAGARLTAQL
jgi:hypothetical protein